MSHVDQSKQLLNFEKKLLLFRSPTNTTESGVLLASSGRSIYLRNYHTFGRADNCHTHLPAKSISRLHAIIFWQDNAWHIEDKSTNGVWVNEHKIQSDRPQVLNKNDTIIFSSKEGETFTLPNNCPPQDLLIPINTDQRPICLIKPIHALSETSTLLCENGGWKFIDNGYLSQNRRVFDGDIITFDSIHYRLQHNQQTSNTSQYLPVAKNLNDLTFQLHVSEDEEDIQLYITDNEQTAEIKGHRIQSQLYLLLYLARQTIEDNNKGYAECHRGWVNLQTLSKDLAIQTENSRIRLHRLRTRIRDVVSFSDVDVCELLQLQNGEVRFNTSKIVIFKGNNQDTSISST